MINADGIKLIHTFIHLIKYLFEDRPLTIQPLNALLNYTWFNFESGCTFYKWLVTLQHVLFFTKSSHPWPTVPFFKTKSPIFLNEKNWRCNCGRMGYAVDALAKILNGIFHNYGTIAKYTDCSLLILLPQGFLNKITTFLCSTHSLRNGFRGPLLF